MTKYNPKYLLPNARTNTGTSFGTKGNSAVSSWAPGTRIFETKSYWKSKVLHPDLTDIGFYARSNTLHMFASNGNANNSYITGPSYGAATDSWTYRTITGSATVITGVIFWNNVWYVCGFSSGSNISGYIWSSTDAITWTVRATLNYGGFRSIGARYNYGLSRNEIAAIGSAMATTYNFASVNDGAFASTSGGGNTSTSAVFADFSIGGNATGDTSGNLHIGYFSGGAITAVATAPIGSSQITAIGRGSYGYTSYYYIANFAGSIAACADTFGSTWTLINSPITANSGDYIVDIFAKSDGQFRNLLLVATARGRIFVGPSNAALYTPWTEVSPAALNSPAGTFYPRYKFLRPFYGYAGFDNATQLGTGLATSNTTIITSMITTSLDTPASRGLIYTDNY